MQLHVFCHASEIAYGAVACFRTVTDGHVIVSFFMSKTRLVPIKILAIPRLELQAVVVAIRLKSKILEEIDFEVDQMHFWSDSKIVLHYKKNLLCTYHTELLKSFLTVTLKSGTISQVRYWLLCISSKRFSLRNPISMIVCGLSLHQGNTESRKTSEQKSIFRIGTLAPQGINERFSFN